MLPRQKENQKKKHRQMTIEKKKTDPKTVTQGLCFFCRICIHSMSVAPFPDLDEARRIKENEAHTKDRKKKKEITS